MIKVKNLRIGFDGVDILKDISFEIRAGEAAVLIGPSGHGKSVLLKAIAGILPLDSGTVSIAKDKTLSMLFQKNALFDSMTNSENISFPMQELAIKAENKDKAAEAYLDAVGLLHAKNLYPEEISGGMQKRLGIARALSVEPKIILYDSPTAGLDPITSREIAKLIRRKQEENNATIISATDDMLRAEQLGERFLFIYQQKIHFFESKKELWSSKDPVIYQFVRGLTEGPLSDYNT